jgi:hypothetical protein
VDTRTLGLDKGPSSFKSLSSSCYTNNEVRTNDDDLIITYFRNTQHQLDPFCKLPPRPQRVDRFCSSQVSFPGLPNISRSNSLSYLHTPSVLPSASIKWPVLPDELKVKARYAETRRLVSTSESEVLIKITRTRGGRRPKGAFCHNFRIELR